MAGPSAITVDLARGEITLGIRRLALVSVGAGAGGAPSRFRLGDDVVVRAITFGERSRLVAEALAHGNPPDRLIILLRATALDGAHSTLSDAVLLALAGGGGEGPAFERCAIDASRVPGWNRDAVHDTLALAVDSAIESASRVTMPGEWNRFVFPAADTRELDELLHEMTNRLLERGRASSDEPRLPERDESSPAPEREKNTRPTDAPPTAVRSARVTLPPTDTRPALSAARWSTGSPPADSPSATAIAGDTGGAPESHERQSAAPRPQASRVVQRAARRALPAPAPGVSRQAGPSARTVAARASFDSPALPALRHGSSVATWPGATSTAAAGHGQPPSAATTARTAVFSPALPQSFEPREGLPARASATAPAFRPLAARTASIAPESYAREAAVRVPVATGPALEDVLDEVARALAAECDLRGLDA